MKVFTSLVIPLSVLLGLYPVLVYHVLPLNALVLVLYCDEDFVPWIFFSAYILAKNIAIELSVISSLITTETDPTKHAYVICDMHTKIVLILIL